MKASVKLISSIGSSSKSTDALGGSAASSLILLSKVSGPSVAFAWRFGLAPEADLWDEAGPFWRVLALLERVASAVVEAVDGGSGRGKDRVDLKGLGRWEGGLEAMKLLLKLDNMAIRKGLLRDDTDD